MWDLVCFAIDG
jgi:hypothetical protein